MQAIIDKEALILHAVTEELRVAERVAPIVHNARRFLSKLEEGVDGLGSRSVYIETVRGWLSDIERAV